MSLEQVTEFTIKGKAINELQRLREKLVAGAGIGADIAVAGIKTIDTILSVLQYDPNGGGAGVGALADLTSEASITSDGNIQLDTTDTTGTQLIVKFFEKPNA